MYIFLDDERIPTDVTWGEPIPFFISTEWVVVRSFDEFRTLLESLTEAPTYISFDHDLGFGHGIPDLETKNGYDCAKYYVDKCIEQGWKVGDYGVHSLNPVGAKNIAAYLENAKEHI